MVYQHFTLVPSMTVAENLVMSRRNVPASSIGAPKIAGLKQFMERMPFKVPLEVEVGSLAAGERQKTEIIKGAQGRPFNLTSFLRPRRRSAAHCRC